MKTIETLLKRAIILTCLSDRCAQEKNIIDGITRSLSERSKQSRAICNWLTKNGYIEECTKEEKAVFNKDVEKTKDIKVLSLQINYECIEPILWTIGLVKQLSDYNNFVLTDFHPILKFGLDHSFERLLKSCEYVSQKDFEIKRTEAMLVFWRCSEVKNNIFNKKGLDTVVDEIFGNKYAEIVLKMNLYDEQAKDFIFNKKPVFELDNAHLSKLIHIAERRFYTFEWIACDDNWDKVDLVY